MNYLHKRQACRVSRTAICRSLQKLGLNRKKKHGTAAKRPPKQSKN